MSIRDRSSCERLRAFVRLTFEILGKRRVGENYRLHAVVANGSAAVERKLTMLSDMNHSSFTRRVRRRAILERKRFHDAGKEVASEL